MRIRKSKRISYTLDNLGSPDKLDSFEGTIENMQSNEPQPLENIATRQLRGLLEDAIDQLSVNFRSVYVMRAIQQLSTRETAESLDISQDLVKTRYFRAKQDLQKAFNKHIENTGLNVYEFLGKRCDAIVVNVLQRCLNKH